MANTIILLKNSGQAGNVPATLYPGELAINYYDGKLYYGNSSSIATQFDVVTEPSGLNGEIQFNNSGVFGASANLKYDTSTKTLSTDKILASVDVTANKLISNNSGGDEGGEILLAKAVTNTTLDGVGITIDSYQNRIRFFEQGGGARGAYIDLTDCVGGAGTNLLNPGSAPDITARNLANSAFDQANLAFDKANSANILAQQAYDSSNTANTWLQANVGGAKIFLLDKIDLLSNGVYANTGELRIDLVSNVNSIYANIGAARIADAAASQANVGAGLITVTNNYQANVGAGLISVTNAYEANVGAARIADRATTEANVGIGIITANTNLKNYADSTFFAKTGGLILGNVEVSGNITPNTDVTWNLGSSSNRWHSLFVGPGSIDLGGTVISNTSGTLSISGASDLVLSDSSTPGFIAISNKANSAFDQANLAFDKANSANILAQQAFDSSNTANTWLQANIGAARIADTAAAQANVGAGLIAVTLAYQANVGSGLISVTNAYQANVGAARIADRATTEANVGSALIESKTFTQTVFDSSNTKVSKNGDTISGDLTVTGNLTIGGTSTTVSATNLAVSDNMLYLNQAILTTITNAVGDGANVVYTTSQTHNYLVGMSVTVTGIDPSGYNTANSGIIGVTSNTFTVASSFTGSYVSGGTARARTNLNPDLGFAAGYNDGTYHHAGLFRDASDGIWKFFYNYAPEPDVSPYIDTSNSTFRIANVTANLITDVITLRGLDPLNYANTIKSGLEANVGAARIADVASGQANVGAGLITVTNNYQANAGAINIAKVNKSGDVMTGALTTSSTLTGSSLISNTSITLNTNSTLSSTTQTTSSTTEFILDFFSSSVYRSAKYFVQITSGSAYQVIEISLVHDGSTVFLVQYGEIRTGASLATFDANITGGQVRLLSTPTNASTTYKAMRTLIPV
jgi:hypothetical protein